MDLTSESELTAQYLWNISMRLSNSCPAASRYYMFNLERKLSSEPSLLKAGVKKRCLYCNHCGSLWTTENHQVRVQPPPSPCGHTKALLRSQKTNPIMSKRQKKHVKKFLEKQKSKIVYTCFICKKKTEFPGIVKPGRKGAEQVSFRTPVPKIKCKKRDLNAGLFVKAAAEDSTRERISNCQDDLLELLSQLDSSIQESESANDSVLSEKASSNSSKAGSASNQLLAKHSTPTNLNQSLRSNPSTTPQIRKNTPAAKRKSLSAKFLNDEQNKKKKKSSLSSFLVSL